MGMLDNVRGQAGKLATEHADKVEAVSDQVIVRAGDAVDQRTGGKHVGHVDKLQQMADERIGE